MKIREIESEEEYRAALKRVEALMDAEGGTPEGQELDRLAALVEAYEDRHYPIGRGRSKPLARKVPL